MSKPKDAWKSKGIAFKLRTGREKTKTAKVASPRKTGKA